MNKEILALGVESAAVHYNLGNGYLRARHLGQAIAAYQRALRLAPRDGDIKANLTYARGLANGQAVSEKKAFWALPFEILSVEELRWSALLIFMLTATVALAGLFAGLKRRKVVWWTVLGGMIVAYNVAGAAMRALEETGRGVAVERVDVTFEPSSQATTYFKLFEGAEVKILREKDGWLKIERFDHKVGWVPVAAVEKV